MGGRLSSSAFVGRAVELGHLDDTFTALPETGASTVLIGGDAGIGKSRLIEEFCRRARTRGALVAVGHCTPAEGGGLPYGPIIGAVRDVSRQLSATDVESKLGRAREWLGLDGLPPDESASGLLKTNLFEAVLQGVAELSESAAVVLVFEDLQWADSASIQVIDFITRNLVERPVMLIASYRTDEVERDRPLRRLVSELGRHGRAFDLDLGGLDRDETAHLLAGILSAPPDWALVDAVQARSGGNPFFAEELAAARHATTLPPSLRNVVMMRIERLSAAARHVVAIASAGGGAMHHRLLSAASRLDAAATDAAVAEAIQEQVLVADAAEGSFRFRHALLREAVYDSLLPGERSSLHRDLAVALTSSPELKAFRASDAVFELADHWWEAGEWNEAFNACLAAADNAAAMMAMHEAHAKFERALIAAERAGYERVPAELLMRAADAAYLDSETARSVELVRQAIHDLDADAEPRLVARCYTMLARNAWAGGDTKVAVDSLRRGAALLPPGEPTVELAGILAEEARILMLTSHFDAAEQKCEAAIAAARATGTLLAESHALITSGCCVAQRGDVEGGLELLRQGRDIAEELASPDQLSRAYANTGHVLMQAGRLAEAANLVFNGAADLNAVDSLRLLDAGQNGAESLIRLGRLQEADELLCRMGDRGTGSCVFGPNGVRAIMAIRSGHFEEADRFLAAAEEMSGGIGTVQVAGQLRTLYAELHLERAEPAAAIAEIERALTVAAGTDDADYTLEMYALGLRAVADDFEQSRVRGRRVDADKVERRAAELLEAAVGIVDFREARHQPCSPRTLAFLAQCRAEASRIGASDADLWHGAAEKWAVAGEPYPRAYCRWREAEALLAGRGERQRAVACVQETWRTAVKLGAPILQNRLERLAARARITLDVQDNDAKSTTVAEDLGLTAREVEVLAQLAKGRTDRQIGEELFISRKTASVHVSNLLRKLDAGNRVEAGEIGQRAGLS